MRPGAGLVRAARRRARGEQGTALVEFTFLGLLLLVPLVYVLLYAFQVQSAAFGVTEAARQAGRAYARADSPGQGAALAGAATALALSDQGIRDGAEPSIVCRPCLAPGSTVRVTVAYTVQLPVVSVLLPAGRGGVTVRASHVEVVDAYQEGG